jgi:hypothetical protein
LFTVRRFLVAAFGAALLAACTSGCGSSTPEKAQVPDNPLPPPAKGARQPIGKGDGGQAQPAAPKAARMPLDPNVK